MAGDRPGRIDPGEYLELDLRAHELLADVPLHDVWRVDLPRSGPGTTVLEIRDLAATGEVMSANLAVRFLFALRRALGRLLKWDDDRTPEASSGSWLDRIPADLRAASLLEPGSPDGPFVVLYADEQESISEAINATVHAFLVVALSPPTPERSLYWAVYVRPGGMLTRAYMGLIDPFRRYVVYPSILRRIRHVWEVHRQADRA